MLAVVVQGSALICTLADIIYLYNFNMLLIRLCEITVCKKSVYSCCLRMYNFIYLYCCHHFIYMYMDVFIRNKLSINKKLAGSGEVRTRDLLRVKQT